jgi:hypothetical protein
MWSSVDDIRKASLDSGHHWFSPSTMRFFGSRVYSDLVGGRFFISSEMDAQGTSRRYTIREALPCASIETVSGFQEFASLRDARKALKALA